MTASTNKIQFERLFLLQELPDPLTRASEHLQFFDNFIENTRICLRTIRAPHTKEWYWLLEQKFPIKENDLSSWSVSRIILNEDEHKAFENFEGRQIKLNERVETNEIRFNRYFYDHQEKTLEIDLYLGKELWGLVICRAVFATLEESEDFDMPEFALIEVTNSILFTGNNLIGKTVADVKKECEKIG